MADAVRKWRRQNTGRLIVYFDLEGIDFGTSRRGARDELQRWSAYREEQIPDLRIIVVENYRWRTPLYPANPGRH